jgi:YD repeat-containing protein
LVPGSSAERQSWLRLKRISNRSGHTIEIDYDHQGDIEWVRDSGGRQVGFEHDAKGRMTVVKLPHPSEHGWLPHTRYSYDANGDLVQVTDPLGHSWKLQYKNHLLAQETNRNGLSFYFAYDGFTQDAFCVRTWGDGGIYDHTIDYDKKGKVTCVTNSLGHTTVYKMNAVGCVVSVADPLGHVTTYDYDERTLQKVKETNPTGGTTAWEYDHRGNTTKVTGPDGAVVEFKLNNLGQPVLAVDSMKGEWQWEYDERGNMVGRTDPLGRRVQFHWQSLGGAPAHGKRISAVVDPVGQKTTLAYDSLGNVFSMKTPDGAESRWHYDSLGRCTAAIDAKGAVQRREHDGLGPGNRSLAPPPRTSSSAAPPPRHLLLRAR